MKPRDWVETVGPHSEPRDVEELLDHRETEESHVLRLLRKRELPSAVIETVARHERWSRRHVVRAAVVNHPKAPRTLALRLLSLLFWKEQLRVASNVRIAMPLRVAAENRLKERLPELEAGEKISMARTAPPTLIAVLASEANPRLIAALLGNPRMREADVVSIVNRDSTPGPVLRVVAQSERWSHRPSVRFPLIAHRNTPVHVALSLLSRLAARDLRKVAKVEGLPRVVALRIERLLSGSDGA